MAVTLPAVCVLGLVNRPELKPVDRVGWAARAPALAGSDPVVLWNRQDLFNPEWVSRCVAEHHPELGPGLRLGLSDARLAPDLLLYWVPGPWEGPGLGPHAELLGRVRDSALLPVPAHKRTSSSGRLALYSLARSEIVDRSILLRWPAGSHTPNP
jgi:hypothetical protein